jgi:cell division protein FtsI (penicillin-binding protein 3)
LSRRAAHPETPRSGDRSSERGGRNGLRKGRLVLVLVLAGVWFVVVALRLAQLQIRHHAHYAERAQRQQQEMVTLNAPRGTIYDARGRELAVSVPVDSAYAEPWRVADPRATAHALAGVLNEVDEDELASRLAGDRASVVVQRKLDAPEARRLRELMAARNLPGIYFVEETKRYYPDRELAAAVLGFAGTDDVGLAGLEQVYEKEVAGRPYRRSLLRDARRETAALPGDGPLRAEAGRDLVLTLDLTLQHIAERELARAVEEHGARGGSVVLLDPRTGGILAMASHPGFDPNEFARFDRSRWRNRAVQDAYEPGSTFKLITAAAALAADAVDPGDILDCGDGEIWIDGRRIRDHKRFRKLTFRQVIAKSSNVGAIRAGLAAGGGRLHAMIYDFGFGVPTGVDLPGEASGIVHPMGDRDRLAAAYVSFGQGLSVTALQLANAFAATANGGVLLRPHVVAEIGAGKGEPALRVPTRKIRRVLHRHTARELERLLEGVVAPEASGHAAAIPGYRVAGKTGTAETAAAAGGYSDTRFVASFVGWAPARDPVLVAAVVIDEPQLPLYHGGQVAAPAFRAIVQRALLYLGAPPRERWVPEISPDGGPEVGPMRLAGGRSRAGRASESEGVDSTGTGDRNAAKTGFPSELWRPPDRKEVGDT